MKAASMSDKTWNVHKRLKRHTPHRCSGPILVHVPELRLKTDRRPAPEQLAPVAHLRCRGQVSVPEYVGAVLGNPLGSLWVGEELRNLGFQVGEVLGHLDKVLLGTIRHQQRVVRLDPHPLVHDDD